MFCNDNLADHYMLAFTLKNQFNWTLSEIENMLPYELEIFIAMTTEYVKE